LDLIKFQKSRGNFTFKAKEMIRLVN